MGWPAGQEPGRRQSKTQPGVAGARAGSPSNPSTTTEPTPRGWLRFVIPTISIITGLVIGTFLPIAVHMVINIPLAMGPKSYSQYSQYVGVEVLVYAILFGWFMHRALSRRFLPSKPSDRSTAERLESAIRHPSVAGLVVAWLVGMATVLGYPVAIFMSWRFYVERRELQTKICPQCAERVKVAAIVCRHCGNAIDPRPSSPRQPTLA